MMLLLMILLAEQRHHLEGDAALRFQEVRLLVQALPPGYFEYSHRNDSHVGSILSCATLQLAYT